MMFELYKKRDVSAFLNDTITFFKAHGKSYFKMYLAVNGPLLVLLGLVAYFLSSFFEDGFMGSFTTMEDTFEANLGYVSIMILVLVVLLVVFSIIAYSFPILYLKNIENKIPHTTSLYLKQIKEIFVRSLGFGLGSTFIIAPVLLLTFAISFALVFLIIGIPILMILSVFTISWITVAYYDFIGAKTPFFRAYGNSFDLIKANFWNIIANTFIIYLIIQILSTIVTMVPQIYFYYNLFTEGQSLEQEMDSESALFTGVMTITVVLTFILSVVFNNILLVNQGLVYYSGQEKKQSTRAFESIEQIGSDD